MLGLHGGYMNREVIRKNYETMLKLSIVEAEGFGVIIANESLGIKMNAYAFDKGFFEVNPENERSKDLIKGFDSYVERGIELVKVPYSVFVEKMLDNDLIVVE